MTPRSPAKSVRPQGNPETSGLSIVELLVGMALMGILSGMSVATFQSKVGQEKLKSVTYEGINWIEDVKKHAIQNDIPCEISIDLLSQQLIIPEQDPEDATYDCTENTLKKLNLNTSLDHAVDLEICSASLNQGESATDSLTTLASLSCSQAASETSEHASTIFSPRGTLTRSLLITLNLAGVKQSRCIALLAPNSMIRSGKVIGGSCDFTAAL